MIFKRVYAMRNILSVAAVLLLTACSWANPFTVSKNGTDKTFEPNRFLWQAAQDKLSFMTIGQEDKAAGVMSTNWSKVSENAAEEFKVEVKVLSPNLRADCLRLTVYKRTKNGSSWREEFASSETTHKMEEAIINRARVLYRESLAFK